MGTTVKTATTSRHLLQRPATLAERLAARLGALEDEFEAVHEEARDRRRTFEEKRDAFNRVEEAHQIAMTALQARSYGLERALDELRDLASTPDREAPPRAGEYSEANHAAVS